VIDPQLVTTASTGYAAVVQDDALVMTKAAGAGDGSASVASSFQATGDFDTSVRVRRNTPAGNAEMGIGVADDSGRVMQIFLVGNGGIQADFTGQPSGTVNVSVATVILRIRRIGTRMIFECDDGAGFVTLLDVADASPTAAVHVETFLRQDQGNPAAHRGTFDNLTVSADSFEASTSTTTTTLPGSCQRLGGKRLLLKPRRLLLASDDATITLGDGNGGTADPVLHGGSIRVVSRGTPPFDDTYDLPADRWRYRGSAGANAGYKLRGAEPVRSLLIRPGRRVTVAAAGIGLGHTLDADPTAVDVVVEIGSHCYCLGFGGDQIYKPGKKWIAKHAPAAAACPPSASPTAAFVD
jgi:hypothetical protein